MDITYFKRKFMLKRIYAEIVLWRDILSGGNRVGAMQKPESQVVDNTRARLWRNFRPVPNVSSFKVSPRLLDQFLVKFDLLRKVPGTVEVQPYRNRDINRYVEHQLKRMEKASDVTYWRIATSLIRRSKCFFILGLNHVFPRWYKTLSWKSIIRLYLSFRRRSVSWWDEGHFFSHQVTPRLVRGYVEKPGTGKYRPLGVPSPSWRIYLHLWAQFLSWKYDCKLSNQQHGFRPGRGTETAWRVIAKEVLQSRNIYEFDLVSFFDSTNLLSIRRQLMLWGVPESIADYLVEVNRRAIPEFQTKDLVDESRLRARGSYFDAPDPFYSSGEYLSGALGTFHDAGADVEVDFFQGTAQGASTSPFLNAVALENSLFTMGNKVVQYADDGLFYGDHINLTPSRSELTGTDEDPWRGVKFHPTKSGWVKKDGVWLKPLKFLGIVYDGLSDTLYSDTRNGKRLFFDKDGLIRAMTSSELVGQLATESSMPESRIKSFEGLILSRFWGFVQSRLYNGSWNSVLAFQNFHFACTRHSWVRRLRFRQVGVLPLTIYNASSVASRSLLEFLRKLDTRSRSDRWLKWRIEADAPLKADKPASRDDERSGVKSAIEWVMSKEWVRAYASTYFAQFEAWMVYYVSRMMPHSIYTQEQMYIHYSLMYFDRRMRKLEALRRELDGIMLGWRASLAGRRYGDVRGENIQYPWAGAAKRRVEFLNSEHDRLASEVGAFQQHAERHFLEGKVYKASSINSLEDYRKAVSYRSGSNKRIS